MSRIPRGCCLEAEERITFRWRKGLRQVSPCLHPSPAPYNKYIIRPTATVGLIQRGVQGSTWQALYVIANHLTASLLCVFVRRPAPIPKHNTTRKREWAFIGQEEQARGSPPPPRVEGSGLSVLGLSIPHCQSLVNYLHKCDKNKGFR